MSEPEEWSTQVNHKNKPPIWILGNEPSWNKGKFIDDELHTRTASEAHEETWQRDLKWATEGNRMRNTQEYNIIEWSDVD